MRKKNRGRRGTPLEAGRPQAEMRQKTRNAYNQAIIVGIILLVISLLLIPYPR